MNPNVITDYSIYKYVKFMCRYRDYPSLANY